MIVGPLYVQWIAGIRSKFRVLHVANVSCDVIRYCIDNGAMIAQAGIFSYQLNNCTSLQDATCTQRLVFHCLLMYYAYVPCVCVSGIVRMQCR